VAIFHNKCEDLVTYTLGIKDTRQSDLTVFSNLLMGIRGTSGVSGIKKKIKM